MENELNEKHSNYANKNEKNNDRSYLFDLESHGEGQSAFNNL